MRHFLGLASLVLLAAACSSGADGSETNGGGFANDKTGVPGESAGAGGGGLYGSSDASAQGYAGSAGMAGAWGGAGGAGGSGGAAVPVADASAFDAGTTSDAAQVEDAAADAVDAAAGDADLCATLDPSKPVVLYQSSDDSNSMASPVLVRRFIQQYQWVPAGFVRTYEFLNYYRIPYTPADAGRVRVVPEMRQGEAGEYTLQIGIQSEHAASPRRPMSLTFVLDTSGSMGNDGRIERERAAVKAIAAQMRQGDRVSMVTWNTQNLVLLKGYAATGPNDPTIVAAADNLSANGGTDLHSGLVTGYGLANQFYEKSLMNRVVLISDGEANVGITDADIIGQASHGADDEGIYLVGVNVGGDAGDDLMNIVTDKGRGASVFLDTEAEAAQMFGPRFDETMEVAARGVRLELTLPWYMTMKTFSGEQSSTNPKEVDPQHLAPSDSMIFNETWTACSPSIVNATDVVSAKATYQTPIFHVAMEDSASATIGDLLAGAHAELDKGSAIFAYAEALKAAQPGTAGAKQTLVDALAKVNAANPSGTDADLNEIAALLTTYAARF